jgi:hypothetical protein
MFKNRLFYVVIAITLGIVITLTIREAAAMAEIMPRTDSSKEANALTCASLPSHYSLHTEYVKELGRWMSYTEDGPTGVDGGLIYLLSSYRTCSTK